MVELLAKHGADVNFIRPSDARRLPDIAEESGHHEIAEFLLRKKRETEEIGRVSYTISIPSEEVPQTAEPSPDSLPRARERPLRPVGFFTTYLMKIGIRRLCPARGGDARKFLVVVFSGPLDLFNDTGHDSLANTENDPNTESFSLTRRYDPKRFALILSGGTTIHGAAISPHWTPVEDSPTSNIFYFDLTKRYASEADLLKGNLAVAWLVESQECKPPFQIRIDGREPIPVPNRCFDSSDDR
jgi:hypothetical protein